MWEQARRRCVALARGYTSNSDEAEDIAHNALLRAWRHRDRLRDEDRFFAWLGVIVRNEAVRAHGRARFEVASVAQLDDSAIDDDVEQVLLRIDVGRELERLSDRERELLRLRYTLDLSPAVIAAHLGMPEGTAKVQLHRARTKLRRTLETS